MLIDGFYLDGNSSKRTEARLELLNDGPMLSLQFNPMDAPKHSLSFTYSQLTIESRLANTPREISLGNDQLFVTQDNDAVDHLIDTYQKLQPRKFANHSILHKLESNLPLISLCSLAVIVFVWSMMVYGIPKAAQVIAFQMPQHASGKPGDSLGVLDQTLFEPSQLTAARQAKIRQLFTPYLAAHQDLNPTLNFRSGIGANALTLPGGALVFSDDFINLAQNDQELLAVLFHELGHIKHQHIIRRAIQDSMITLLVIFITGDIDSIDLLTGLPTLIVDLSYSRNFEREADSYALEQLHRFNIPLTAFATIMARLEQFDPALSGDGGATKTKSTSLIPDFLSTHPPTAERITLVEQFKKKYRLD